MTDSFVAPGEHDLSIMLATMAPVRDPVDYVFCTGPDDPPRTDVLMTFREREGLTRILPATNERDELRYAHIELRVHSSLAAVGLTAAVSAALTQADISANVVAGYYHDHIFVPQARADDALDALLRLSASSR